MKLKSRFFEKINKFGKPLTRLAKETKKKTKIRNKSGDITIDFIVKNTVREYHEQLYACLLSRVQLFGTPWTVTRLTPLSMEFSRQEY